MGYINNQTSHLLYLGSTQLIITVLHSLNNGLLSVRLQLGNVDARGVGECTAEAQSGLEALVPVDRDVHSGSEKFGQFSMVSF